MRPDFTLGLLTWLYAYGVELPELRWGSTPDGEGDPENQNAHGGLDAWRDAWGGRRDQWRVAITDEWPDSSPRKPHMGQTATTPPLFRDVLLAMARTASVGSSKRF